MNVVSIDRGLEKIGLKCRGLKRTWSQMNGSQWNGLKWTGLNSHGTALINVELDRLGIQLASLSETWWC